MAANAEIVESVLNPKAPDELGRVVDRLDLRKARAIERGVLSLRLSNRDVERVLSDKQSDLWRVYGILRIVLRSMDAANNDDGVNWSDVEWCIETALDVLTPVVESMEPCAIAGDARRARDLRAARASRHPQR